MQKTWKLNEHQYSAVGLLKANPIYLTYYVLVKKTSQFRVLESECTALRWYDCHPNFTDIHSGQTDLPVQKSWRLNERHYGGLTGLNKAETAEKHGEKQVQAII